jgi:heat shock protein HtpX
MASFFDEISRNRIKSILLMILFGLLFSVIIFFLVFILGGGLFAFAIGILLVLAYAVFSYSYGSKFVLKVSGAQEADRGKYPDLYNVVEGLALATQIKMPKVYIIQDQNPNAFATGKNKNNAYVAVTTGLLAMMTKTELQGVIAHEMSHIQNNDIQFMMIAVVFAGAIGLMGALIRNSILFGAVGGERRNGGILIIVGIVVGLLAPLFAILLKLAISRRREYMADANGARITRAPMYLSSALKKIAAYEQKPNVPGMKKANEMTASLYFANPLSAKSMGNLFSTHPPIQDRINKLDHMY